MNITGKIKKPKARSPLRLTLGKFYFTIRRHLYWRFGGLNFAKPSPANLGHIYITHQTPLLRKLKDVDMHLQHNKITNLRLAIARLDGTTILPGQTFSYWRLIGRPTRRKGYVTGMVLNGGKVKTGVGGGLCQLSNLIYWMALHTPLTVTERHRHSYDVFPDQQRTQPFGSGATCFYNYGDLMLHNSTEQAFRLNLALTKTHLTGTITSDQPPHCTYQVYEKAHIIQKEFWGGHTRHNLLCRKKFDLNGSILQDEVLTENHAIMMYAPLLEQQNHPV